MSRKSQTCWICGDVGTTGEHIIKRSDLRSVFRMPTQKSPLFYHDDKKRNRWIASLDNERLKSPSRICAKCNNERTQPYDYAWETLSRELRTYSPAIKAETFVRANKVFKYNTKQHMLCVHLFFVKLFGCHIDAFKIPIDIGPFSNAILNRKAHPRVYLNFGWDTFTAEKPRVCVTDMHVEKSIDGQSIVASWIYLINGLGVNVMYATEGEERQGLVNAWHPRFGSNRLFFSDFR